IRSCRKMGIRTVAVYSTVDRESLQVRFADEAIFKGTTFSKFYYLNVPNIIAAAEITNADAIHPGYGLLAEIVEFARVCQEYNIKFIGDSPEMINKMGDKASAKETMNKAGVPKIPGSDCLLKTKEEGLKIANE